MTQSSWKIALVWQDRQKLRALLHFLSAFGYDVRPICHRQHLQPGLHNEAFDFVVLQQPDDAEWESAMGEIKAVGTARPHVLVCPDSSTPESMLAALEAGADDLLEPPLTHGELLARLRAGARRLEFESRLAQHLGRDPATGLPEAAALQRLLSRETEHKRPRACVAVGVDFLPPGASDGGAPFPPSPLRSFTEHLADALPEAGQLFAERPGRWLATWEAASVDDALAWTETTRTIFTRETTDSGEPANGVVVSFGVAHAPEGTAKTALADDALEALAQAQASGGGCTVRQGEFAEEESHWQELARPGRMFHQCQAGDIALSTPVTLRRTDTAATARRLLQQTGFEAIPVVDGHGRLDGLVFAEDAWDTGTKNGSNATVADIVTVGMPSLEETAPCDKLLALFSDDDSLSAVVIVSDGRPTGIVTATNLLTLVEPISRDTFAARSGRESEEIPLCVPEVSAAEA